MSVLIPDRELVSLSELKVDGNNPNIMSDKQHERLATSIKKYGFIVPIITNKDLLIADGEQRWTVAKSLNMAQVPVIRLPVEDVDRRLLRQVLNKLRGEHDLTADALEFERIIEAGRTDDLKHLLDLSDNGLEKYLREIREVKDEDYEVPEIDKIETDIKRGDILTLGNHRLMCGDATDKQDVSSLMDDKKADMVFTDPPYNVGFMSRAHKKHPLDYTSEPYADNKTPKEWKAFVESIFTTFKELLVDGGCFYLWGGQRGIVSYYNWITEPLLIHQNIIWDKQWAFLNRRDFLSAYESCVYGWKKGKDHLFQRQPDGQNLSDIWAVKKINPNIMVHSAENPVDLVTNAIISSSEIYSNVIDLFGGSGSTLIACEQTGRTCYMMEIDPRYCQVIVDRWEKYTGQKAVKLTLEKGITIEEKH